MESISLTDGLKQAVSQNIDSIDEDVIHEAINGSKDAFLIVVEKYKIYLYKTAYLYVKNEHDASEIYQQTIFKAYLGIRKLKKTKYFKTWITRILINNVYDSFRNVSRIINIEEAQLFDNFNELVSIEEKVDLYSAIDCLDNNHKTAIILKYFHDMSIKDISEVMNCSENTVKSFVHRAKKVLKRNLREE